VRRQTVTVERIAAPDAFRDYFKTNYGPTVAQAGAAIRIVVVGHSLELFIWVGLAGVALSSVQIALWNTRRVLRQSRQTTLVQDIGLLSPATLAPSAMTRSASSALAS